MKKTIYYLFITALIPLSCAQQYANVGQQFANSQSNGAQQFGQNQYQFWRPQFDHGGQYQSQPRFQPQQQQYQQQPQQYQPQQPPQQQFQAPPQQQFQPQQQQYQPQPQQVYQQPQIQQVQQQVQQPIQQVQQFQPQQFQPQQGYQQQPQQPQQQEYQAPQVPQQQFVPQQPRQPVYQQQQQFNQAPPQQQQVYQPQPQVIQQQAPPPPPVNQAPPQQQFQQAYPQHVYREQPQLFQQQQKQPYPQQQFEQQQVNRSPPQIYQHEFTVSQPAPPPPAPVVYQPPPAPATPAPPPPPERFFPHISDLYTGPSGSSPNGYHIDAPITIIETEKNEGPYIAEEIVVDGHHPSYIENTERMQPPPPLQPQIVHNRPQPRFIPQESILQSPDLPVASFDRPKQINRPQPAQVAPVRPPQPPPVQQSRLQSKPVVTQSRQPETVSAPSSAKKAPSPTGTTARASEVFLDCCQKRKVVKACERICSFDVLSKKTLTGMFLGTDPCPQSHGRDLLQCAAQNEDHTECCKDMGVHTTSAGNKCLGFCNMKPGVTFQADVSMLPCWGVLNDIKTCFKQYIEDHKL